MCRATRHHGRLSRAAFWGCCIVLAAASLMPVRPGSPLGATSIRRTINDLLHIPAYALLAWLWCAQINGWAGRRMTLVPLLAGCAGAVGFGALMEVLQHVIPGRVGSMKDLAFNSVGAAAAGVVFLWQTRRQKDAGRHRR